MNNAPFPALIQQVTAIAQNASAVILDVYKGNFEVQRKSDASPVTKADVAAQQVIIAGLAQLSDALPVISEEATITPWSQRRHWQKYWLVDPLDGTREFVKRNGQFTVNIALVEDHQPILGVILAPVSGELYVAARGQGAWMQQSAGSWQRIGTRPLARVPMVAGSRSFYDKGGPLLRHLLGEHYHQLSLGSSLKFCLLARGDADIYLRCGETYEWDTAAAQSVLTEAGGAVLDLAGEPLQYNRKDSLVNPEFLAVGDVSIDWKARLQAVRADEP